MYDEEQNQNSDNSSNLVGSIMSSISDTATGLNDYRERAKKTLNSTESSASQNIPHYINENPPGWINATGNKAKASDEKNMTASGKEGSKINHTTGATVATATAASAASMAGTAVGAANKINQSGMGKIAKMAPAALVGILLLPVILFVAIIASPSLLFSQIGANTKRAMFSSTTNEIEQKSEYVTAEQLSNGEISDDYSNRLEMRGATVGQVTASGDFIKTNIYLAELDAGEIAAVGDFKATNSEQGSLSIMYDDGTIVSADNFVSDVESNPAHYAIFKNALAASAGYYYSNGVDKAYTNLGLSRSYFSAASDVTDEEFAEAVKKIMNSDSKAEISFVYDEEKEKTSTSEDGKTTTETVTETTSNSASASSYSAGTEFIDGVVKAARYADNSTSKAATALNTALSANEPYQAARASTMLLSCIDQVIAGDNGPIHQCMNMITKETDTTYTDSRTGETITKTAAVVESPNFLAMITDGNYDAENARNFSRDRITNMVADVNNINGDEKFTTALNSASSSSYANSHSAFRFQFSGLFDNADSSQLQIAAPSIEQSFYSDMSDMIYGESGGNLMVEGASFLSNTIDSRNAGALPSDENTIIAYYQDIDRIIARQAAADRATLSPFDITSRYTLLGSIVHQMSSFALSNLGKNTSITSGFGTLIKTTNSSLATLVNGSYADSLVSHDYHVNIGDCPTQETVSVNGELYCNTNNTIDLSTMKWTMEDFANANIGVDEKGNIKDETGIAAETIVLGFNREATVGVQSAEVCDRYVKDFKEGASFFKGITDAIGITDTCTHISNVATGKDYVLSSNNERFDDMKKVSGYALEVAALEVTGYYGSSKNPIVAYTDKYYEQNPLDDSAAGYIARISGMSKEDSTLALAYATYLAYLKNYDPSTRYAFSHPFIESSKIKIPLTNHNDFMGLLAISKERYLSISCLRNGITTTI